MTLILPNSVFLHVPKTGGTWVRKAIINAGFDPELIRANNRSQSYNNTLDSWHNVPEWDERYRSQKNRFCFVRDPIEWYRSYWAFRMWRKNWEIRENPFDNLCHSSDFPIFIDKVIYHYSDGYLTWLYSYFANHCTYVGKAEELPFSLIPVLKLFEGDVNEDAIVSTERLKVTPKTYKEHAVYSDGQIDKLRRIEVEAIDRYGYH